MKLEIITPEKKLFDGEIESIQVPGSKGSFAVFTNHAPIISTLARGMIKIVTSTMKEKTFEVTGGVIEVHKNNIVVLTDLT